MHSDPNRLLRRSTLCAAAMLAASGICNQASALTIGGNPADALDPRNAPFNAVPNDGQDDREVQRSEPKPSSKPWRATA
jgi:hypothetical protein